MSLHRQPVSCYSTFVSVPVPTAPRGSVDLTGETGTLGLRTGERGVLPASTESCQDPQVTCGTKGGSPGGHHSTTTRRVTHVGGE